MDRRTLRTIAISALAAMAVSLVFALPGASRSDALEKRIEELSAEISRQHDENEEMAASIAVLEAEIEFGVTFDQTELSEENLETTSAFIRLLESKR